MKKIQINSIRDFDFKDKNVFMRVDFNVPLEQGKVMDSFRIEKTLPSIYFVLEQGGHLLLASHLGRPKGNPDPKFSLRPIAEYLNQYTGLEIFFVEYPKSNVPKTLLAGLKKNQLILLENLRFHPGEAAKDKRFAKHLASYTDIYINEAFGISHRDHTSVSLLPKQLSHKGIGFQFATEMAKLDEIKSSKLKKPFVVILGGNKVDTKIPLMEALIDQADEFCIGGLLAYTFLKARGKKVSDHLVNKNLLSKVALFVERIKQRGKKIFLPLDHVIEQKGNGKVTDINDVPVDTTCRDIGPMTLKLFQERIKNAGSVFWNGPMGFFEKKEFASGTFGLAKSIADNKKAYRLVGGGHSALAVKDFTQCIDHVSTGGGASMYYLQGQELPGLKNLIMN